MLFQYKAINPQGKIIAGKISAANEKELEAKLKLSNLDLVTASQYKELSISFLNRITMKELIMICIHLNQMEKASVPILDSIAELRDNFDSPKVREIMVEVYDALRNGKMLSEALAMHPLIFDKIFIGLISAGEKSGSFEVVFQHLEDHYKWLFDIKKKLQKATYYPIFLFLLIAVVLGIMLVYVIPKLTNFLTTQNIPLPGYTVALISFSDFVLNYWYILLFSPLILFLIIKILTSFSRPMKVLFDRIYLNLPIFGTLIRKIELARFCHFLLMTYKSGMGIIECLRVSGEGCNNLIIKDSVTDIISLVSEGQTLTDALIATGEFPNLVTRMFRVGEQGGNLENALANINMFYETEVDDGVNGLVASLQPMLTIIMGGMMMWITLSVFGPIYSSFGA